MLFVALYLNQLVSRTVLVLSVGHHHHLTVAVAMSAKVIPAKVPAGILIRCEGA